MTQPIANARFRPMIAPIFAPVIISAAITSVYAVIAPWIPVTVVPTSFATVAIETFITELSSVIRNCPVASVSSTSMAGAARPAEALTGTTPACSRASSRTAPAAPSGGTPRFERAMSGSNSRSSISSAVSALRASIMISELR